MATLQSDLETPAIQTAAPPEILAESSYTSTTSRTPSRTPSPSISPPPQTTSRKSITSTTPARTPSDMNADYQRRRTERGLLGYQAIADFINSAVPGAKLTRDHIYPLNIKKTGIVLEAKTERAKVLLKNFRYWSITTPWKEIIEAGELQAAWDEFGPRPILPADATPGKQKSEECNEDSDEEAGLSWREREKLKKQKKKEARKKSNELANVRNRERKAQIMAACVLVADYINEMLPGADVTVDDITMTGLWKKGIKVKPLSQRASYIGGRVQRFEWPEGVILNMRTILDSNELEVTWATEEVEAPKEANPTLANGGVMRGLIFRKKGKGHFAGMNKEEERLEKKRIRKRAVEIYTNWLNSKLPEAELTGERTTYNYLLASGIIVQTHTHRARRLKDSYSTWPISLCDILKDILDDGEVEAKWDEYGPRKCLPVGDESEEESAYLELSDSELFTDKIYTPKPPSPPKRQAWVQRTKQKLADWINSVVSDANIEADDAKPAALNAKHGIFLHGKTERAKNVAKYSCSKWRMDTPLDDMLKRGELIAYRRFDPIDKWLDPDMEITDHTLQNAYRKRFQRYAQGFIAKMINDTLTGANVVAEHVSRAKLMSEYGIYLVAKSDRARFFFNHPHTSNWPQSTPIEEILDAGELVAKYDDDKLAEIEEKKRICLNHRPKRKREVHYPSSTPRRGRNSKRVKYEESDEDDFDESASEEFDDEEDQDEESTNKPKAETPEEDSDDESFLQPQLLGNRKCSSATPGKTLKTPASARASSSELSDLESSPDTLSDQYTDGETPTQKGCRKNAVANKANITTLKLTSSSVKKVLENSAPMKKLVLERIKTVVANYVNSILEGANLTHDKVSPAGLAEVGIRMLVASTRAAVLLKEPEEWYFHEGSIHDILDSGEVVVQLINGEDMKEKVTGEKVVGVEYVKEFMRIANLDKSSETRKFSAETLKMRFQMQGMGKEWEALVDEVMEGT